MPKPYRLALRRKVVEAIALNGMKRCEAHEHFNIRLLAVAQFNDWLALYEQTSGLKPREYKESKVWRANQLTLISCVLFINNGPQVAA